MSERNSIIDTIFEKYQIDGYDMLINIIESYKSHKCNSIPVENTQKIKNDNKNKIEELTSKINSLSSQIEEMKNSHKKEIDELKSEYERKLKEKEKPLPTPSNSNENRNDTTKKCGINKFCISDYCKIKTYNDVDEDVKKDIMKELLNSIKMYSDIYIKIKEMSDTKKIIDWLIRNRHIKYYEKNDKNRYRVINKYKRSYELFQTFKDDLQYIYFSFSKMTTISVKYWDDWVNILKVKINEEKLKYQTPKNCGINNSS